MLEGSKVLGTIGLSNLNMGKFTLLIFAVTFIGLDTINQYTGKRNNQ